jgi:uncharacterized protein (TIGR03435 family)
VRALICTGFIALVARAVFAQADDASPKFDAADVHASPPKSPEYDSGDEEPVRPRALRIKERHAGDLIRTAWNVEADKVVGGPDWLDTDRFDVTAAVSDKTPAGSTPEALRAMLRNLLADRFRLVAATIQGVSRLMR